LLLHLMEWNFASAKVVHQIGVGHRLSGRGV